MPKRKPSGSKDDLYVILWFHWERCTKVYDDEKQRVYVAAGILLAFISGCRPVSLFDTRIKKPLTKRKRGHRETLATNTTSIERVEKDSRPGEGDMPGRPARKRRTPAFNSSDMESSAKEPQVKCPATRSVKRMEVNYGGIVGKRGKKREVFPVNDGNKQRDHQRSFRSLRGAGGREWVGLSTGACDAGMCDVDADVGSDTERDSITGTDPKYIFGESEPGSEPDEASVCAVIDADIQRPIHRESDNIMDSGYSSEAAVLASKSDLDFINKVTDDEYDTGPEVTGALLWRHIAFHVIRNPLPGRSNILIAQITLLHTKGEEKKPRV